MRFDQPRDPILIIHLADEHKAAPDERWIRLTQQTWGWSVEASLPADIRFYGPSKCGYLPDLETVESKAIEAAIEHGIEVLFVDVG